MMKRVLAIVLILGLVTLALAGCGGGGGDKIKIGAAGPYSGELSKIGLDSLNAIKMAVEEINEKGGIKGRQVEVVVGDDAGDPSKGVVVAEKFASDQAVLGVIGPMNSNVVNAALPVYEKNDLAIISQSATNTELTEQGYKTMFRIAPRDDDQGKVAAEFIVGEIGAKRVYIIDDKGTYGQGLADQVETSLRALGVTAIERGQVASTDKDFAAILGRVESFGPDLLYLALPNPSQASALIKQAKDLGLNPALMGGDGLKEKDQLIAASGGDAEGMYVTAIGRDIKEIPDAAGFVEKFEGKYGAMSIFSGQSYEATMVLLDAIERAMDGQGNVDRKGVMEALRNTDYTGILGIPIKFDEKGDMVVSSVYVLQVKGDDFVEVAGPGL